MRKRKRSHQRISNETRNLTCALSTTVRGGRATHHWFDLSTKHTRAGAANCGKSHNKKKRQKETIVHDCQNPLFTNNCVSLSTRFLTSTRSPTLNTRLSVLGALRERRKDDRVLILPVVSLRTSSWGTKETEHSIERMENQLQPHSRWTVKRTKSLRKVELQKIPV